MVPPADVSAYGVQEAEEAAARADVFYKLGAENTSTNSCAGERDWRGFPELCMSC